MGSYPFLMVAFFLLCVPAARAQYIFSRGYGDDTYLRGPVRTVLLYDSTGFLRGGGNPEPTYMEFNRHGDMVNVGSRREPASMTYSYRYDLRGRRVEMVQTFGGYRLLEKEDPAEQIIRQYIYRYASNTLSEVLQYHLPGDSLTGREQHLYDSLSRLTSVIRTNDSGNVLGGMYINHRTNGISDIIYYYPNVSHKPHSLIRTLDRNAYVVSDTYVRSDPRNPAPGDTSVRYVYTNDSLGNPLMVIRDIRGERVDTLTYMYTYDSHGNWITKRCYERKLIGHIKRYTDTPVLSIARRREILYYSNSTGYPLNRRPRFPFEE